MIATTVVVQYRQEGDWHVFTAPELPNLMVASPNRSAAYNDVAKALNYLFYENEGLSCNFQPEVSAEEFFGGLAAPEGLVDLHSGVGTTQETAAVRVSHCLSDAVSHEPGRLIGDSEHPVELVA